MHEWLGEQLDRFRIERGSQAEPHRPARQRQVDDRHAVLRAASGRRRLGAVHLDRLRHQAAGASSTWRTSKRELIDNRRLAADYPQSAGRGPRWQRPAIELPNGVVIEVVRHRAADPRPAAPRASADADRLRRPAERQPHLVGRPARVVAALVSRHAAEGRHEAARTSSTWPRRLHREALAMELLTARRLDVGAVRRHSSRGRRTSSLWNEWEAIYCDVDNPRRQAGRRAILTSDIARRWTPAPSCSGRRRRTCTR